MLLYFAHDRLFCTFQSTHQKPLLRVIEGGDDDEDEDGGGDDDDDYGVLRCIGYYIAAATM